MDWTTEELLLANSPSAASAMQSLVTWLDGMPIQDPVEPPITQSNAPPGVTVVDGMPIQNYNPVTVDPMANLPSLPTVDPMANLPAPTLLFNAEGQFVPITPSVAPMGLPGLPIAAVTPVTMPAAPSTEAPVSVVLFGNDHGGGPG